MNYYILKIIRMVKHIQKFNVPVDYIAVGDYLFHEFKSVASLKEDMEVIAEGSDYFVITFKNMELKFINNSWIVDPENKMSSKKISTASGSYLVSDFYIKLLEQ